MNFRCILAAVLLIMVSTCSYAQEGYYILGSSGIGKPIMTGDDVTGKYSFPIHTDWFFNEFRIPGFQAGYEYWRLEAEDSGGELHDVNMNFIDIGASWSVFRSRILGMKGGWIIPLDISTNRYTNNSGPKGWYAGVFFLGNMDPYWLELGFKRYFWREPAYFGDLRNPGLWTIDPPGGIIYITIHYRLYENFY